MFPPAHHSAERSIPGLTPGPGGFAREALEREAIRLGVSVEELARFAVSYYLADLDSGRIAREWPPRSPEHDHPLGRLLDG